MAKYRDRSRVGRSRVVPFDRDQDWKSRHDARKMAAASQQEHLRSWCEARGVALRVTNGGHHYTFTNGCRVAEWWPSSAKLVFDRAYRRGVHVHDAEQVKVQISRRWGLG